MKEWNDLLRALGLVVVRAAGLDEELRRVFVALTGDKHKAVDAAGQMTKWLVSGCRDQIAAREFADRKRLAPLSEILAECETLNRRRNRHVHDAWATGADGEQQQIQSKSGTHQPVVHTVTVADVEDVANGIGQCTAMLGIRRHELFAPDEVNLEAQMRWDDYLNSRTPEQIDDLMKARIRAIEAQRREADYRPTD